jgi:hypothetical protein
VATVSSSSKRPALYVYKDCDLLPSDTITQSTTQSVQYHLHSHQSLTTNTFTSLNMGSIPTEQWAQVIEKTGGPVDYKKIPVQKPASDEVLVNIKFSGVCHTDLHAVNGDWPLVSSPLLPHFFRSTITNIPLGHQATSCRRSRGCRYRSRQGRARQRHRDWRLRRCQVAQRILPGLRVLPIVRRATVPQAPPFWLHC